MTLAFTQQINGVPTYFPEKIWSGIRDHEITQELADYLHSKYAPKKSILDLAPKIHTIRADKANRWKPGNDIHFVINNRTKNRLQFAPVLKVTAVQTIEIKHLVGYAEVLIDGKHFGEIYHHGINEIYEYSNELEKLASNDGLWPIEEFFSYFKEDFTGKIIHWTNFKY